MSSITKPKILYPRGVVKKMAKSFGVDEKTVRNALNFVTESELAEMIRSEAVKCYGARLVRLPVTVK